MKTLTIILPAKAKVSETATLGVTEQPDALIATPMLFAMIEAGIESGAFEVWSGYVGTHDVIYPDEAAA